MSRKISKTKESVDFSSIKDIEVHFGFPDSPKRKLDGKMLKKPRFYFDAFNEASDPLKMSYSEKREYNQTTGKHEFMKIQRTSVEF